MSMDHKTWLSQVPPADRATLTARSDRAGLLHLVGHFGAIVVTSALIIAQVPYWPLLLPVQGMLIVFLFTLEHECTHQTPFASTGLNEGVGHVCGVFLLLPFRWFRAFHLAHHRWTNLPGQDPELDAAKPETAPGWVWHISGLPYWIGTIGVILRLATGRATAPYLPKTALKPMQTEARVLIGLYALALGSLLVSPLVLWLWLIPVVLGQPLLRLYLLAEHGDCPQVTNMFANTRTTFTTALVRFIAWNMPYHTEHHVWPQVPFHQLPALHNRLKSHLGVTADGYAAFTKSYLARRNERVPK